MAYDGEYGASETCRHDIYRRNCWRCNGDVDRFAREYAGTIDHPKLAQGIKVSSRRIVVYTAECPSPVCHWARHGVTNKTKLEKDIAEHIAYCRAVAVDWAAASDIKSEAAARGLL